MGDETIKKYEDGELVDDVVACVIPNIPESNTTYVNGITLVGNETLDGYTPKNKKMYTYPYNFFNMDNGNGSNLQLRYEFFDNCDIKIFIALLVNCRIFLDTCQRKR